MPGVFVFSREHRKAALSLVRFVVPKPSTLEPAGILGLGWRMACSEQLLALTQMWALHFLPSAVREFTEGPSAFHRKMPMASSSF